MERKKNLQTDYLTIPLMEMFIIHQNKILQEFNLLNKRFDKIELLVSSQRPIKNKEKEFFTTEEVMVMLCISKRTLLSFRNAGKIRFTKTGNMVRFTREDIEEFMRGGSN